jgi:aminoglycoside/choline kinase family phosphotransferase
MQRLQQLTAWLSSQLPQAVFELAPASADASFRRYFRATFADGQTRIVMDAPPQHEDCRPFLHIARLFEDAGTHVPHVYAQDLEQGFLLLSDLGSTTYLQALCDGDAGTARELYGAATDALIRIQLASRENELPPYGEALLRRELNLFPEWYVARHLQIALDEKQSAALETVFRRILANNLAQPRVYVHRDYHSRNLMYVESLSPNSPTLAGERGADSLREFLFNPGILDFQDAIYGPITYDLASLFKDAYIRWEEAQVMDWLIRYWEKARRAGLPVHADFGEFYRDYEWMGVQRHLKVLGIFARLCHRDGKEGYLKDMPLVMDYLRRACERYIELKPLLNLLDELEPRGMQAGFTF